MIIKAEAARVEARASFIGSPPRAEYLESARQLAESALAMAPDHPQPLWALGYVRFYEGKCKEALQYLDRAVLFGGERAELRDLIGRILTEEGPIERALSHLEHALILDPSQVSTVIDLSRLYGYLEQWDRVDEVLSHPISSIQIMAVEITKARFLLWRDRSEVGLTLRDREREGDLFSTLIDIFRDKKRRDLKFSPRNAMSISDDSPHKPHQIFIFTVYC